MRSYYNATDIYIYIYSIDVDCFMSFVLKYLNQFEVVRLHDVVKKMKKKVYIYGLKIEVISLQTMLYILLFVSTAYSYITDIHLDM